MSDRRVESTKARRNFLTRLSVGVVALDATLAGRDAIAQTPAPGGPGWQPARHTQDEWLDQIPGKHRFVFDSTSASGLGNVLLYVNNTFLANQSGYGLGNGDLAVVIVVRHNSTPFAYGDGVWSQYGAIMAEASAFEDPKTKKWAAANLFNAAGYGTALPNFGVTVDSLVKRGVHFAVCQMATRRLAGLIATAKASTADAIYNEIVGNLVGNAHMVPAGIVAVNRAQEHGYSFAVGT